MVSIKRGAITCRDVDGLAAAPDSLPISLALNLAVLYAEIT